MWQIKTFKTRAGMNRWLDKHKNIQYTEIVINQPTHRHCTFALEYCKLRVAYR